MLTPERIAEIPEPIVKMFREIEDDVISDIAESFKLIGSLTEDDIYKIDTLAIMGQSPRRIVRNLSKELNMTISHINKTMKEIAKETYEDDYKLFHSGGKTIERYEENETIQQIVRAIAVSTENNFEDISKSIGFVDDIKGFSSIERHYKHAIDKAIFSASTGVYSYEEAAYRAVDDIAKKGIKVISFESGVYRSLDSHVRSLIVDGVTRLSNEISRQNMFDTGQCYVETSAHMGARPTHANWQGKVFYWKDMDKEGDNNSAGYPEFIESTEYGSGSGLGGWNCRHTFYPFFIGISKEKYSTGELKAINEKTVTYRDKTMSVYEANQKQRQLERNIRATKRLIIANQVMENEEKLCQLNIKLRLQNKAYQEYSNSIKTSQKIARLRQTGYNKDIEKQSRKAIYNQYKGYLGIFDENKINKKIDEIIKADKLHLLKGYKEAIDKGHISPLVGIDIYIETAKKIDKHLIGLTTKDGVTIRSYRIHFIDRVIGQHSAYDKGISGKRKGVHIADLKECILNGECEEVKFDRFKLINHKCRVIIEKDGQLVQCNYINKRGKSSWYNTQKSKNRN